MTLGVKLLDVLSLVAVRSARSQQHLILFLAMGEGFSLYPHLSVAFLVQTMKHYCGWEDIIIPVIGLKVSAKLG